MFIALTLHVPVILCTIAQCTLWHKVNHGPLNQSSLNAGLRLLGTVYPTKHVALPKCWGNVGPPSTTLDQHYSQHVVNILCLLGYNVQCHDLHIQSVKSINCSNRHVAQCGLFCSSQCT